MLVSSLPIKSLSLTRHLRFFLSPGLNFLALFQIVQLLMYSAFNLHGSTDCLDRARPLKGGKKREREKFTPSPVAVVLSTLPRRKLDLSCTPSRPLRARTTG